MIILSMFKVLEDKSHNKTLGNRINLKKWTNDYDFGFDIFSSKAWRKYLTYEFKLENGKLLPTKTDKGDDVCYRIHVWGVNKEMAGIAKEKGMQGRLLELFPGFTTEMVRRPIQFYGRIRR